METTNPKTTISEKKEITLQEVYKEAGEKMARKMELSGRPETRAPSWPMMKVGLIVGFQMGGDFGYKLAERVAKECPIKDESTPKDETQLELFDNEAVLPVQNPET